MKFASVSKRLATVGVATALVGGAVVGTTATSASAAPVTGTYTCDVPLIGAVDFPVSVDAPGLPTTVPAGLPVPAGLLPINMVMSAPSAVATLLGQLAVTGGSSSDFAMLLGGAPVPVQNLALTSIAPQSDGSALLSAAGSNGAFTTPLPGTYDLTLPSSFSLVPTNAGGALPALPCTTKDGAAPEKYTSVTVVKQDSTTTAKNVKVRKGHRAKLVVKVVNMTSNATGKVVAKMGSKKVGTGTVTAGKTTIKLTKMGVGKHKITLRYLGDQITKASKGAAIVKVVR